MLIARPYRDLNVTDKKPPKVIAEIRKTFLNSAMSTLRLRLSADLLVKFPGEKAWNPRKVQVKNGHLQAIAAKDSGQTSIRIALRHLSLQAGPVCNSLAICRGQNVLLTLQTSDEKSFDRWVKVLAIELIRQTPLDAIKYLDILTLAECWNRKEENYMKDWNSNLVVPNNEPSMVNREQITVPKCNKNLQSMPNKKSLLKRNLFITGTTPEEVVENLLKKCQNVENYVPVKEKLFLFESLCKMGRKVRSSEDVSLKPERPATKRARSCHDLTNLNKQIAVKEICKYFESKR